MFPQGYVKLAPLSLLNTNRDCRLELTPIMIRLLTLPFLFYSHCTYPVFLVAHPT